MANRLTNKKFQTQGSLITFGGGTRFINETTAATAANNTIYFIALGRINTVITGCNVRYHCTAAGATVTSAEMYIGRGIPQLGYYCNIEILSSQSIASQVATASGGSAGWKTIKIAVSTQVAGDYLWLGWHHVGTGLPTYRGTQNNDLVDGLILGGASTNTVAFSGGSVTKMIHTTQTAFTPIMTVVNFYTQ